MKFVYYPNIMEIRNTSTILLTKILKSMKILYKISLLITKNEFRLLIVIREENYD